MGSVIVNFIDAGIIIAFVVAVGLVIRMGKLLF